MSKITDTFQNSTNGMPKSKTFSYTNNLVIIVNYKIDDLFAQVKPH